MVKAVTAQEKIDHELSYLTDAWEGLEEILTFDADSRLDYAVDWPLKTMAQERLQALVAQHGITPAVQARYDHLRMLQTQNAPLLDQLLSS